MSQPATGTPLAILGYGLCTPLGLSAEVAAAEMAAGTPAFAETEVTDRAGDPVRAARLPLIPVKASRTDRMLLLARTALEDLLSRPPPHLKEARMPLLLALPSPAEGGAAFDAQAITAALADAVRAVTGTYRKPAATVRAVAGRAGFFAALADADRLLAGGEADHVLIGAVDSLCDPASLQALARANRVFGGANPDGLIPGEGAGFLIVGPRKSAGPCGHLLTHATAQGAAAGAPPASAGQALASVFRRLGAVAPRRPRHVFSSQPSERRWARELSVSMLRASPAMPEPFAITRITDSVGDPAAAGAMILTVAALLAETEPDAGPALIYGISDDGLAGGLLVASA